MQHWLLFLTDCTAIGYWHGTVVCPSVCLSDDVHCGAQGQRMGLIVVWLL